MQYPKTILLISSFLLFLTHSTTAQNIDYARQIIDTLASPTMHGRGYVKDGNKVAAAYIAEEFERLKLRAFGSEYYQYFSLDVNTFPGAMFVEVNGKPLKTGIDYMVSPASMGIKGKYKAYKFGYKALSQPAEQFETMITKKKYRNKVIMLDPAGLTKQEAQGKIAILKSYMPAAAFIDVSETKLTWHIAGEVFTYPEIKIKKEVLPTKLKCVKFDIEQEYLTGYESQNVIGFITGTKKPTEFVVFTAHYDHLGRMGEDHYIPGANDNASGVAMLLNLAEYYQQNPPDYTVVFMAFGGEETGLLGSKHFVENPLFSIEKIRFLVNMDIVGTGDEGITVVNSTAFIDEYEELEAINDAKKYLPHIKERGPASNSDHWFFYEKDVPCFFIYTMGGIQAYHDVNDRAETLPLTEFEDLMRLLVDFVKIL